MLAIDTGQVWWSHEASSYRGLALDDDVVFLSTADGEVVALKARTGAQIWRQNALLHRGLSGVAVMDDALVTADFQGYVHWLDKTDGALMARAQDGKARVSTTPVVIGNTVLVINDRGRLTAYRTTPRASPTKPGKHAASTKASTPAKDTPATGTPATDSTPAESK
jgi:outer membrane protein assembly factor BamB